MWTKLCGFKDVETARIAATAGADAIGLNFWPESVRSVGRSVATEIVETVREQSMCVGLFVNASQDEIAATVNATHLQGVQLHGDESPVFLAELSKALPGIPIIKAFSVDDSGLGEVAAYVSACQLLGELPWACLVDAKVPGQRGGTGQTAPWEMIEQEYREEWPNLILAGGLAVTNVATAIRTTEPWGIATASGVESSRGVKDATMMQEFLALSQTL